MTQTSTTSGQQPLPLEIPPYKHITSVVVRKNDEVVNRYDDRDEEFHDLRPIFRELRKQGVNWTRTRFTTWPEFTDDGLAFGLAPGGDRYEVQLVRG